MSGINNTKYFEFTNLHYNKLNEIMSKIRYRNKVKLENDKDFYIKFELFKDTITKIPLVTQNVAVKIAINIESEYLLKSYTIPIANQVKFDYTFVKVDENESFRKTLQVRLIVRSNPEWVKIFYDNKNGVIKISGLPPNNSRLNFD